MNAELWPIDRPTPYAANPRENEDAVEVVARSLAAFGWQQPIVVDPEGVVIAGHTRLKAARKLGWTEVPVVVSALDPDQAKAYRIADNRTHEEARWDAGLLRVELERLQLEEFDTALTGFSHHSVSALLAPNETVEDETAAAADETLVLSWAKRKVQMTEGERDALAARFDAHLNQTGLAYGFVRALLAA